MEHKKVQVQWPFDCGILTTTPVTSRCNGSRSNTLHPVHLTLKSFVNCVQNRFLFTFKQLSLDSSVGRAEDCRGTNADILRALVRIRFEGCFLPIQSNLDLVTVNLVTILDLVTFFRKTNFLCSKKVDLVTFWKILEPWFRVQ